MSPDASLDIVAPRLHLGAAYYPEHWPEERWPEDIRLMREAGLTVVRMAEFAWSTLEPAPGVFDFDWLERAIALLAEAGIASVLGTPTAAPPAWLVEQYPDMLPEDETGRRVQFGNRCHYCVTSPEFHAATSRLVGALAARFGPNPHVIGWQIDNEYNRVCYCPRCRALFQRFLADRYGSLEELNRRWATAYWSQTYSAWEQIPLPIGRHNPGLMLEFRRFVTECYRRFQRLQIDLLRPHLAPGVWITHNFLGWQGDYDQYVLARDLDLASWDCYIGAGHHDYLRTGALHALARGLKRRNFWVMETQPGNVDWARVNNALHRDEARALAWQAVAHGADAVLYWQWRSALGGQEQYHGTLIDQSGQPRPFYEEVKQLGLEFGVLSEHLAGSTVRSRVAIVNSYDSRWSVEAQRHHADFDYVAHLEHWYRPVAARNLAVDIVPPDADLDPYKMVIAPALVVLDPAWVENLRRFVERSGHLVLTLRTGMKDTANALLPSRQPGPLATLAGVEVEEYYALDEPVPVKGNWFEGVSRLWAERLRVLDPNRTAVIARYGPSNGWLDDQIAITVSVQRLGTVYTVGAYLDPAAQQAMVDHFLSSAALPKITTPPGVEIRTRFRPDGQEIAIVVNHERAVATVSLPWPAHDPLTGQPVTGPFRLAPYGVAVLARS